MRSNARIKNAPPGGARRRSTSMCALSALAVPLLGIVAFALHATDALAAPLRDPVGLLHMLDADGDTRLDRHEVRGTPLASAFFRLDVDGDGCLNARELAAEGLVRTAIGPDDDPRAPI